MIDPFLCVGVSFLCGLNFLIPGYVFFLTPTPFFICFLKYSYYICIMKSREEIELLASEKYSNSAFSYAQEGPYVSGYMECQEEIGKMYTLEEIQEVLDGFTGDAPGFYIKTNFIELLKK